MKILTDKEELIEEFKIGKLIIKLNEINEFKPSLNTYYVDIYDYYNDDSVISLTLETKEVCKILDELIKYRKDNK